MARYAVVRVGSNAANQSMTQRMIVGFYKSKRPLRRGRAYTYHVGRFLELASAAAERGDAVEVPTVYNNQHLEMVPTARMRAARLEQLPDTLPFVVEP